MSSPEEWLVCGLCSAKVMMKNIAGIAKAAQVHNLPEKSSLNASFVCLDDEADSSNQVRQMFNNPVHRRLLARLLKVELEVIPSRFQHFRSS